MIPSLAMLVAYGAAIGAGCAIALRVCDWLAAAALWAARRHRCPWNARGTAQDAPHAVR